MITKKKNFLTLFNRPGFGLTDRPLRTHEIWSKFIFPKKSDLPLPTNPLHETFAQESLPQDILDSIDKNSEWINPYSLEFGDILAIKLLEYLFGEDKNQWGNVILLGHSLGGSCAAQCAFRSSEIFHALVLIDAALFAAIPGGVFSSWMFSNVGRLIIRHIIPRTTPGSMAFVSMENSLNEEQISMYRRIFRVPDWDESLFEFGKFQVQYVLPASEILPHIQVPSKKIYIFNILIYLFLFPK